MKTRIFLLFFWGTLILTACDDSVSKVGMGIMPDEDRISIYDTIISFNTSTVKVDSVYAKTIYGYLGEVYDPDYGTVKSTFACQFYPSIPFEPDSLYLNEDGAYVIDSVDFEIFFNDYVGDSLAPMQLSVYPITGEIKEHYYTNVNPEEFVDLGGDPLTTYGYTARNAYVSDSLISEGYPRGISVPLPMEFGQRFMDEALKEEPNAFSSVNRFTDFFPGFYLDTKGIGSMINVSDCRVAVYYKRLFTTTSSTDEDSLIVRTSYAVFKVTKEMIQVNSVQNANDDYLLEPNDERTYIKSPLGVYTMISIPLKEISEGLKSRKFNGANFSIKAFDRENQWEYAFGPPGTGIISSIDKTASRLLLIEPDSVKSFFEDKKVADSKSTFVTTLNTSTYSYDYTNISTLLQKILTEDPERESLDLLLIPILTNYYTYNSGNYDYASSVFLRPSGISLKKGEDNLQIRIIASDLESNQ